MRKLRLFLLAAMCTAFSACGEIENEYCSRTAFLYFDNSTHLDQTLGAAMNSVVSNVFCRVYQSGTSQLSFTNNQGASSTVTLTAKEVNTSISLGVRNDFGLIVGYGFGGVFYCYDALCSNCYNNGSKRLLSMNSSGIATCSNCGRQYDLANNGLSPQGGRLDRYWAETSGSNGVLRVSNR